MEEIKTALNFREPQLYGYLFDCPVYVSELVPEGEVWFFTARTKVILEGLKDGKA